MTGVATVTAAVVVTALVVAAEVAETGRICSRSIRNSIISLYTSSGRSSSDNSISSSRSNNSSNSKGCRTAVAATGSVAEVVEVAASRAVIIAAKETVTELEVVVVVF